MISTNIARGAMAIALVGGLLLRPSLAAAQSPSFCPPGQSPKFQLGIGDLQQQLGTVMGEPVECEHSDDASGDTLQKTTTGLAYYRKSTNLASFTTGSDHWALFPAGLGHWSGPSPDPPVPVPADLAFIAQLQTALGRDADLAGRMITASAGVAQGQQDESDLLPTLQQVEAEATDVAMQVAGLQATPSTATIQQLALGIQNDWVADIDELIQAVQTDDPDQSAQLASDASRRSLAIIRRTADLRAETVPFLSQAAR